MTLSSSSSRTPRAGEPPARARRRIGLLLNTLSYSYQNAILLGVHQELANRDVDLCCFSGGQIGDPDQLARSSIYDLIGRGSLDGLIVTTSTLAHEVDQAEVLEFCRRFAPVPLCSIGY